MLSGSLSSYEFCWMKNVQHFWKKIGSGLSLYLFLEEMENGLFIFGFSACAVVAKAAS